MPFFKATVDDSVALDALISNWDLSLPSSLGYGHLDVNARGEITRNINQFYFGNEATPTNQLDKQALMNVSKKMHQKGVKLTRILVVYRQVPSIY